VQDDHSSKSAERRRRRFDDGWSRDSRLVDQQRQRQ
jgi:hypothetical protein